jgi:hypothetical protein
MLLVGTIKIWCKIKRHIYTGFGCVKCKRAVHVVGILLLPVPTTIVESKMENKHNIAIYSFLVHHCSCGGDKTTIRDR